MGKLWGGRFKKELHEEAKTYSYSLATDFRLAYYDIQVNLAHAKALREQEILTEKELIDLDTFFQDLAGRFADEADELLGDDEDIHSCIERLATEALGDLGKKIHTGKSRNDQVITDVRLYMMDEISLAIEDIEVLLKTLCELAETHKSVVFPGFTHLQTAMPVSFGHHLLAYFEKFARDRGRLIHAFESTDVCPLGSAALAGNNYNLNRMLVAEELGFSTLSRNSMDAVSDRDFMIEFIQSAAQTMVHLSQFCEELILWSSPLVGFVTIGDDFTTGSSIMPQKKNPDIAELIRGRSGRVVGHSAGFLTLVKGLPMTYNRDLQEDKELLFDTVDILRPSIRCFYQMLQTLVLDQEKISAALNQGHILATEFADYLAKKGVPFRDSHELTGKAVLLADEKGVQIHELSLDELQSVSDSVEADVSDVFSFEKAVNLKTSIGGTSLDSIEAQLTLLKETFKW